MEALIHKLSSNNIDVDVIGDQLKLQIPDGIDATEIISEVKQHKEALISFIRQVKAGRDFSRIAPCGLKPHYALSSAQRRLYFMYEFDRDSLAYNMPQVIALKGTPDREKLNAAVNRLVERHESLRTAFRIVNEEPVQCIEPVIDFSIEYSEASEAVAPARIQQFIRPFKLEQAPLIRIGVVSLSGNEAERWLLMVDMHHIITDGVSGDIILNDFKALYNNEHLPALRLQYKDYAEWQQAPEQQKEMAAQQQFWLQEFTGELPALSLPADLPRPLTNSHRGAHFAFELSAADTAALRQIAAASGATLFMVVLAVYNILLAKLSNQEDVVIGTPVAGRPHADLEQIIGMFVNVLSLRNYPAGALSFRDFLEQVKGRTVACFDHQLYQFEDLVNALKIKRDTARNPLFDIFYVYEYAADQQTNAADELFQPVSTGHTVAKFDLTLLTVETAAQLLMRFEYAADLFTPATIERFAGYFKRIVAAVIANAATPLSEISLLSAAEKDQLLSAYNNTSFNYPATSVIALFEEQAAKAPLGIAIRAADTEVSYEELDTRAAKLAAVLKAAGMQAGQVVAILQERSVACVVSILAVLKNGGVYLPLDVTFPDERIRFMLNDSGAAFLLTEKQYLDGRILTGPAILLLEDVAAQDVLPIPAGASRSSQDNIYIIYTSGSTGMPKGVMGSQRGLLNRLYWGWDQYPYAAAEVACLKTNLGFVDHVAELFAPLLKGIPLVMVSNSQLQDVETFAAVLADNKVSRITLVPSLLQSLIRLKKHSRLQLGALKYVFCSGEELSFYLARQFYQEFGQTRLVNIYGSSEVSADVTCYNVERFNVEEVLTYFRQSSAIGATTDFTTSHVPLQEIAARFLNSRVADYPVTLEEYYQRLYRDVLPYTINTASPTFIGHMTSVLPDYVHDISKLISQLNQNLVKVETSKSVTFLEREAIAMLHRQFYELPADFYTTHIQQLNANLGIITSGGSTANISALLSARNKALYGTGDVTTKGASIYTRLQALGYRDMVVIGSALMHYSFKKAVSVMGLGTDNIVLVKSDGNGRMCTTDLQQQIAGCREQGLLILAIVGIAGSTERGSIDPLGEIGAIARRHNIHFHVDAAWGGALMFSDRYRSLLDGIQEADSITCCGHKQLYLPQGISVCLFRDPAQLGFNATTASYQATANSYDTGRFTIEGSRPALSLTLHASLNVLAKKGYELLIDGNLERAAQFAALVKAIPAFELLSCQINIVNYRYIPHAFREKVQQYRLNENEQAAINEVNTRIQEYQFLKGNTFVSRTTINHAVYGKCVVFRVVLSNPLTSNNDLLHVLQDHLLVANELYAEQYDPQQIITALPAEEQPTEEDRLRYGHVKIPIGKPLYNTQIYILDKYMQLQPPGVPGEICVAGHALANGYAGKPQLQRETFVDHPFINGAKLYRTGDLGKWLPSGNIVYLGRIDRQVKIRGFRIEPGEIEQVLYEQEDILHAAVMVREKQGEHYLVAYYVPGKEVTVKTLRDFLAGRLPAYMLPAHYVQLDNMPLTASGKIDRKQLPDLEGSQVARRFYEAPGTFTEALLAEVWETLLGISGISIHDNFFEIGGHSLSAIRLAAAVKRKMEVTLPLSIIFQLGNIRLIAGWIDVTGGQAAALPDEDYEEIKL